MGQEAARKTNIILRESVKNGYLAVRLTVRVNPPPPCLWGGHLILLFDSVGPLSLYGPDVPAAHQGKIPDFSSKSGPFPEMFWNCSGFLVIICGEKKQIRALSPESGLPQGLKNITESKFSIKYR